MEIREADPDESAEIASILNAAYLQTDTESIRETVQSGAVLVAEESEHSVTAMSGDVGEQPILGVLVLAGNEITEIAVRPGRRGQGLGRALVTAVCQRKDRVFASFDPTVRPFWESVGFEVTDRSDSDRLRGAYR